ncbi:MAG: energy transducer TonB [Bacteroidota bacterium]
MKIIKEFFICTGLVFVTLFLLISFQYGCKQKGGESREIVVKKDTTHIFKSKIDTITSDKEKPFVSTMGCYLPPVVMPDTDVDDNVPKIVPPVIYLDDDEDHINNKSNNTVNLEDSKFLNELDNQKIEENDSDRGMIVDPVYPMPDFPGGYDALVEYFKREIKYPDSARVKGIEGTVYVTFVVSKLGDINSVKVLRGIGSGCDEEAVRVVKAMPRWKPELQNGIPVPVQMNIPIKFNLH